MLLLCYSYCTLASTVRIIRFLTILTSLILLCFNLALALSLTRSPGFLPRSTVTSSPMLLLTSPYKYSPAAVSTEQQEDEVSSFSRQCLLMCFVLVSLSLLPKITYDAFDACHEQHGKYFELNTFLMTRTLMYVSAYVQAVCVVKFL